MEHVRLLDKNGNEVFGEFRYGGFKGDLLVVTLYRIYEKKFLFWKFKYKGYPINKIGNRIIGTCSLKSITKYNKEEKIKEMCDDALMHLNYTIRHYESINKGRKALEDT